MKLSKYKLEDIVPEHIFQNLTATQIKQAKRAARRPFSRLHNVGSYSSNPAVLYLALKTPAKYEVFQLSTVSESDLLHMLVFDSASLDPYYHMVWGSSDTARGLWEQHMTNVVAALGNPNIEPSTVEELLEGVLRSDPNNHEESLLAETIGYHLFDRSDGRHLTSGVLGSLHRFFTHYGVSSYADKTAALM